MEYEDRQESWQKTTEPENTQALPKIRDRFLDLPRRTTVIKDDDVLNLRITLETVTTIDELISQM
jgi:hypothetical protein